MGCWCCQEQPWGILNRNSKLPPWIPIVWGQVICSYALGECSLKEERRIDFLDTFIKPMEMFYLLQDWVWSWSSAMGKRIHNNWGGVWGNRHQNYCVHTLNRWAFWMCPCFPVSFLLGHRTGQTDFKNDQREVSCEIFCVNRPCLGFCIPMIGLGLWRRDCLGNVSVIFLFFFSGR